MARLLSPVPCRSVASGGRGADYLIFVGTPKPEWTPDRADIRQHLNLLASARRRSMSARTWSEIMAQARAG